MLKTFRVTNFGSIGETQELNLLIGKKDILDDSATAIDDRSALNLVAALIGQNASGKTTILKALTFALYMARYSYHIKDDEIAFEPHSLFPEDASTIFEIEYLEGKKLYKYILEINKNVIRKEYLGINVEKGFTRIFEYQRTEDDWDFKLSNDKKRKLKINRADILRFKKRKSSTVLSSLINLDYLPNIAFFQNGFTNVDHYGLITRNHSFHDLFEVFDALYKNSTLKEKTITLLKEFDLGIDDLTFKEITLSDRENIESPRKQQILQGVHKTKTNSFVLDYLFESNGTQAATILISKLIPVLEFGGLITIDEIESGLHPYVIKKIISLFESKKNNPRGAQLIFTTHQHLLLNDRTKTQIFIVEKSPDSLESEVFRLDCIEGIRNDENYFNKYITGVYGGTPAIEFF